MEVTAIDFDPAGGQSIWIKWSDVPGELEWERIWWLAFRRCSPVLWAFGWEWCQDFQEQYFCRFSRAQSGTWWWVTVDWEPSQPDWLLAYTSFLLFICCTLPLFHIRLGPLLGPDLSLWGIEGDSCDAQVTHPQVVMATCPSLSALDLLIEILHLPETQSSPFPPFS